MLSLVFRILREILSAGRVSRRVAMDVSIVASSFGVAASLASFCIVISMCFEAFGVGTYLDGPEYPLASLVCAIRGFGHNQTVLRHFLHQLICIGLGDLSNHKFISIKLDFLCSEGETRLTLLCKFALTSVALYGRF